MCQYYVNILRLTYSLEVMKKHGRDHVRIPITSEKVYVPYLEDVVPTPLCISKSAKVSHQIAWTGNHNNAQT